MLHLYWSTDPSLTSVFDEEFVSRSRVSYVWFYLYIVIQIRIKNDLLSAEVELFRIIAMKEESEKQNIGIAPGTRRNTENIAYNFFPKKKNVTISVDRKKLYQIYFYNETQVRWTGERYVSHLSAIGDSVLPVT